MNSKPSNCKLLQFYNLPQQINISAEMHAFVKALKIIPLSQTKITIFSEFKSCWQALQHKDDFNLRISKTLKKNSCKSTDNWTHQTNPCT